MHLIWLLLLISSSFADQKQESTKTSYEVLKVIDGDTIKVKMPTGIEKIRIIGLDTPEIKDSRKPVQCFGKEASERAKQILEGKKVFLLSDPTQGERGKFKRLLRYVILEDGSNFSEKMIREGYGHEFTYGVPYKYQDKFKAAQKDARENKRGLWADDACKEFNAKKPSAINSKYKCDCNKTCPKLTCDEAYFQLKQCGCQIRDADKDGIPCEAQCKGKK